MKPIIILISILLLSIVISCTVRNYRLPFQRDKPHVIIQEVPLPLKKVELIPVPDIHRDTTTPPAPEEQVIIHALDTAVLRHWFDQAHFGGRYRTSIMDDPRVLGVIRQAGATMDENEDLLKQLIQSVQEKEKAEQEVKVIKNVIFNAPIYMWLLHIFFALIMILMIYKVHYSRMKIQAYIDGRINKL